MHKSGEISPVDVDLLQIFEEAVGTLRLIQPPSGTPELITQNKICMAKPHDHQERHIRTQKHLKWLWGDENRYEEMKMTKERLEVIKTNWRI